jgi:predicted short-subunit dehydrogenase-like oxidoreductase (DUF2520 family)
LFSFFIMKYTIYIIGAGKVGTSLLRVLNRKPFCVTRITDTKPGPLSVVRNKIPLVSCSTILNRNDLIASNVILITVQDDQILPVVTRLLRHPITWKNKIILHTSGVHSSQVLNKLHHHGAETGSFHPMQTFHRVFLPAGIFKNIFFTFEGSSAAEKFCRLLARTVDARFLKIRSEVKGMYHLGGVVTANFLVALLYFGQNVFREAGFSASQTDAFFKTLVGRTLHNFIREGAKKTLTGPLRRGDVATICQHLEILRQYPPEYSNLYTTISRFIARQLVELKNKRRNQMLKVLHV